MAQRLDEAPPGFASALVWQSARGTVVPWVVQVDNLGQAQTVASATALSKKPLRFVSAIGG